MSFPRYVFRIPGPRKKRGVPDHDRALCVDAAAHAKAKAAGWSDSIAEAVEAAKKPAPAPKPAAPKPAQPAPKGDA